MLNFALRSDGKTYESGEPEKMPQRVLAVVEVLIQQDVQAMNLKEALRAPDKISSSLARRLQSHPEVQALGVFVLAIKPTPETARALDAEAREAILKSSDEAIFARRNAAVAQECTIRETQMETEASVGRKKSELRQTSMEADITIEDRRKAFVALNAENTRTMAGAEAHRLTAAMKALESRMQSQLLSRIMLTTLPAKICLEANEFHSLSESNKLDCRNPTNKSRSKRVTRVAGTARQQFTFPRNKFCGNSNSL